ncbi:sodium:solute symporter family protein [Alicyclobacillus sp. TC]|uniref:SSS family solute:Na+ symporter n=2 Tax=Alicyclobacillus tolerans TaxID=90970 RepID=A0ABT9LSA0_9BACL|nr:MULTISPECIES: sodium:solute symporter family protein [Alicyclobacillus]MDP9727141.1 SSS family solute:Na+ symporter [Alicyclobacillus tengchongensis]QRF22910.1 sodium:solute symporter family protein [Alicyclobacillus sp. TC]SHK47187.1 solute:Na+ symporter, SSS family [Alicyclobacillus montanus]
MHEAPIILIFATMLVALCLALLSKKRKRLDMEQWSVGGRRFGVLFVFLLLAGEIYTTFTFLGGSGWAYGTGGPTVYILAYGAVAYLFSYFLLPPIWRYAKRHQLISQPDFFVRQFNSPALGVLVALVGVVAIIPYLQSQMTGLGLIVQMASYGALPQWVAIAIAMFLLAIYVTVSGIYGTAWTAVLKDILILAVVLVVGIALPIRAGGLHQLMVHINQEKPGFLTLGQHGMGIPWFLSTVALTGLGFYMWPHAFGAVYTAKNERIFRRNATFLPLYQLILLFVFFAGFAAIWIVPGLKNTNLALLAAVQKTFPAWLVGVIGSAGVLTAIVPGSLMMMCAGTLVAENLYKPCFKNASSQQVQRVARVVVWLVAIVTFLFSIHSNATIVALLLMGYNFVSQFFPTVLLTLFAPSNVTKAGAFSGIVIGVVLVVYFTLTKQSILWGANTGFWALLVNMLVVLLVSVATRQKSLSPAQVNTGM